MTDTQPSIVALIPARAGSKRVPDKNIRPLAGHPLVAYTIAAALQSEIFAAVIVSTDSKLYSDIAKYYGAEVPYSRPPELAGDFSPDIEWVEYKKKNQRARLFREQKNERTKELNRRNKKEIEKELKREKELKKNTFFKYPKKLNWFILSLIAVTGIFAFYKRKC